MMDAKFLRVEKDDVSLLVGVLEHAINEGEHALADDPHYVAFSRGDHQRTRQSLEALRRYVTVLQQPPAENATRAREMLGLGIIPDE